MRKIIIYFIIAMLFATPALASESQIGPYVGTMVEEEMFIPLRGILQEFGYQVNWDATQKTAVLKNKDQHIQLTVNNKTALVNGSTVAVDSSPVIEDGQVYIPLRFVGQAIGADVNWNNQTQTAIVKYSDKSASVFVNNQEKIKKYSRTFNVNNRNISVNVVEIPLHAAVPDMVVAGDTVGKTEELASMAKRSNASVAINGTFFNAYGGEPIPYGNIIKNGSIVHRGSVGTTAGFRADGTAKFGHVEFRDISDSLSEYGWGDIRIGIGAGPRLLTNGKVSVDPVGEGFTSAKILEMRASRSALGVKQDGTVILATTVGNMDEIASVMQQLGAYDAMNLDGGASSGLWFKGTYITSPGRLLSNALIFK